MREPAFWYRPSSWISLLLTPLGALYGLVAGRRLQREGFDAGIPVLCVGNYHVGGAGKTPAVLALTMVLRDIGETPVVLSRGYGGSLHGPIKVDPERHAAVDVGDEPLMLARTVPASAGETLPRRLLPPSPRRESRCYQRISRRTTHRWRRCAANACSSSPGSAIPPGFSGRCAPAGSRLSGSGLSPITIRFRNARSKH